MYLEHRARLPYIRRVNARPLNLAGYSSLGVIPGLDLVLNLGVSRFAERKAAKDVLEQFRQAGVEAFKSYLPLMGKVPGRVIGTDALQMIWVGAAGAGGRDDAFFTAQIGRIVSEDKLPTHGAGGSLMLRVLAKGFALINKFPNYLSQTDDPRKIIELWVKELPPVLHKYVVPNASARQIAIDAADALVAQAKPNAPLYYAQGYEATFTPPPVTAPITVTPTPISAPITVTPTPVSVPEPILSFQPVFPAPAIPSMPPSLFAPPSSEPITVTNGVPKAREIPRGVPPWILAGGFALGAALLMGARRRRRR